MTPSTKFRGGTYKLYAIVSPWRQIVSHIRKTHDFWCYTKSFLASPSKGLAVVMVAHRLFSLLLENKNNINMGLTIWSYNSSYIFILKWMLQYHVKASALNLASGCQGALVSAGQVFSFLVASFLGPPLLSCSGRSWPQQMLNTAGESSRPRCRGG